MNWLVLSSFLFSGVCQASMPYVANDYTTKKLSLIKDIVKNKASKVQIHKPKLKMNVRPNRNSFLKGLYGKNIVEASFLTAHLSDKLLFGRVLTEYLGVSQAYKFYPTTMGLKQFVLENGLVDDSSLVIADRLKIIAALKKAFPFGFIVKPTAGINSQGRDFYFDESEFVEDLMVMKKGLLEDSDFLNPFEGTSAGLALSGEKWIIQENVITAAGYKKIKKAKEFDEVRVHTLEGRVVLGATYGRWEDKPVTEVQKKKAEKLVQEFLDALPLALTNKQAWSLDVAVLDNGVVRIIEANTNRGKARHWSGFLSSPWVLEKYTNHLETHHNVQFMSWSGMLLRNGWANFPKYFYKKYIEKTM